MNRPSNTPGICRIDQPAKHNHGYFVRLQRNGKIHSAFFADKRHGGRENALAAAQQHYGKLLEKLGLTIEMSRQRWAEIRRRKGSSNIVGVQKIVVRRKGKVRKYWKATWSPEPYVVARKQFSVRKHGAKTAKLLAMLARRAGVQSMLNVQPDRNRAKVDALFIEQTLDQHLKWVVFEPNNESLWEQIRLRVGVFMHDLFRQGAFQGQTPSEAYFVKCDQETTTQDDISHGIVNILVGFALLKPAEFEVIKIQQQAGQIET